MKQWKLFPLIAILAISGLKAQTSNFRIIGYVPNWIDVTAFSNSFDFSRVTHLNYAFQNPDANGNLVESNTGLSALVKKAHENNVEVLISLGGGSAADGTVKTNYQSNISTEEKRSAFINKIMNYVRKFDLDGVDVDEEGGAINNNYEPFIKQLHDSLKVENLSISAAVGWGGENIKNSTLPLFDWVCIMSYDLTGSWAPSNPGQHSPYSYAVSTINDWLKRGVKKENLVLGVPFYGYGFGKENVYISYKDVLAKYPDKYTVDEVKITGQAYYYNGTVTMWKKTKLAQQKTSGVMIWELSQDVKGEKSLLGIIKNTVDSGATSVIAAPDLSDLQVFPNPASNYITVESSNGSVGKYILMNQLGQIVISGSSAANSVSVNVHGLVPGIYFMRINEGSAEVRRKIIIQ